MRHSRFRDAVGTLAAPIHGRPKDELDSEDVRQHRSFTRVRRFVVTAIGVLLVLAVAAGILAWQQRGTAQQERDTAQRQARIATSQALAAQAQVVSSTQPSLAVNLALHAYELSPTFEARSAMAALVDANRPVRAHFTRGSEQVKDYRGAGSPPVNIVALSRDGQILAHHAALENEDDSIHVYNVSTRTEVGLLPNRKPLSPTTSGMSMDERGRRLVVYDYGDLEIWDLLSRTVVMTIQPGPSLRSALISPDGRWVVTANSEGPSGPAKIQVWNAETGGEVGHWQTSGSHPAIRFRGDSGSLLAISGADGQVREFDLTRGDWGDTRSFPVMDNAFVFPTETGDRAVVFDSERLRTLDLSDQRELASRAVPDTAANGIEVSADGNTVVVGSLTGEVDVYDENLEHVAEVNRYQRGVVTVSLSADGGVVASTAEDGSLTVSVPTDRDRLTSDPGQPAVASMDGAVALLGRQDTVEVWDVRAREKRGTLPFPMPGGGAAVDVTEKATRAAVVVDNVVSLWDLATAERLGQVDISADQASLSGASLTRFLPDQRSLVAMSPNSTPVVVDTRDFTLSQRFDGVTFAMSADRRVLAVLSSEGVVEIWHWRDSGVFEQVQRIAMGESQSDAEVAVDPLGERVAVADGDGRLFVARIGDDHEPRQVGGRLTSINSRIAFSGDGTIVLQDGNWAGQSSLLLWDVDSGELLAHWPLTRSQSYSTGLSQVVASPGSAAVTVGPDGVAQWDVSVERWHDTLCAIRKADLSAQERQRYLANVDVDTPCRRK